MEIIKNDYFALVLSLVLWCLSLAETGHEGEAKRVWKGEWMSERESTQHLLLDNSRMRPVQSRKTNTWPRAHSPGGGQKYVQEGAK